MLQFAGLTGRQIEEEQKAVLKFQGFVKRCWARLTQEALLHHVLLVIVVTSDPCEASWRQSCGRLLIKGFDRTLSELFRDVLLCTLICFRTTSSFPVHQNRIQ